MSQSRILICREVIKRIMIGFISCIRVPIKCEKAPPVLKTFEFYNFCLRKATGMSSSFVFWIDKIEDVEECESKTLTNTVSRNYPFLVDYSIWSNSILSLASDFDFLKIPRGIIIFDSSRFHKQASLRKQALSLPAWFLSETSYEEKSVRWYKIWLYWLCRKPHTPERWNCADSLSQISISTIIFLGNSFLDFSHRLLINSFEQRETW